MYNPPRRKKVHLSLEPEVHDLLMQLSRKESRTRSDQVSWLVMERARTLGLTRQLGEQFRDGDAGIPP